MKTMEQPAHNAIRYGFNELKEKLKLAGCVFEDGDIFVAPDGERWCVREIHHYQRSDQEAFIIRCFRSATISPQ